MNGSRTPLLRKCLTAAVAVALVAAPAVQASSASSSASSYFWSDVAIVGGVLAGILVLGLWGDVAIGAAIFGIQLLAAGAAVAARKVGTHARAATRRAPRESSALPIAARQTRSS